MALVIIIRVVGSLGIAHVPSHPAQVVAASIFVSVAVVSAAGSEFPFGLGGQAEVQVVFLKYLVQSSAELLTFLPVDAFHGLLGILAVIAPVVVHHSVPQLLGHLGLPDVIVVEGHSVDGTLGVVGVGSLFVGRAHVKRAVAHIHHPPRDALVSELAILDVCGIGHIHREQATRAGDVIPNVEMCRSLGQTREHDIVSVEGKVHDAVIEVGDSVVARSVEDFHGFDLSYLHPDDRTAQVEPVIVVEVQCQPQADARRCRIGVKRAATRHAATRGRAVEGTAAHDALAALIGADGVKLDFVTVIGIPVLAPLKHVTAHVIDAFLVGHLLGHIMGRVVTVALVPSHKRERVAAGISVAPASTGSAGGIFPLGLGGQAERQSCDFAQSGDEPLAFLPAHAGHGMLHLGVKHVRRVAHHRIPQGAGDLGLADVVVRQGDAVHGLLVVGCRGALLAGSSHRIDALGDVDHLEVDAVDVKITVKITRRPCNDDREPR